MSLFEIILLAAALGIDCLIVSFSQGLVFKENRIKTSMALAVTMGIFQGIMPVLGFVFADIISDYVSAFAHWLVFAIFFILGIKFITEAFQEKEEKICSPGIKCLISMGFATSVDALAAGASLNLTQSGLIIPALIIGAVSFFMSLTGFWSGNFFAKFPSKFLEITGGGILILLAVKNVL